MVALREDMKRRLAQQGSGLQKRVDDLTAALQDAMQRLQAEQRDHGATEARRAETGEKLAAAQSKLRVLQEKHALVLSEHQGCGPRAAELSARLARAHHPWGRRPVAAAAHAPPGLAGSGTEHRHRPAQQPARPHLAPLRCAGRARRRR